MRKYYPIIALTIMCCVAQVHRQEIITDPIELIGFRSDKNSVGHGINVALYPGEKPLIFFATHKLGPIFSPANQTVCEWFTDHVKLSPEKQNKEITAQCELCVTEQDVIVAQYTIINNQNLPQIYVITILGDNRQSINWRGKVGGAKKSYTEDDFVVLSDRNVYPEIFKNFYEVIGSSEKPKSVETKTPGCYNVKYGISIPANSQKTCIFACAVGPDKDETKQRLKEVIKQKDPIAKNRADWQRFFTKEIPRFSCSDQQLEQLYYFRWFLLKFSTAGGNLGYYKYPVVMEGRAAYQTYCCYSAPFMALDMNWAKDPQVGFGHFANMINCQYEDGRFPWYTAPNTNRVPLHHKSASGNSFLPAAAWEHYKIHGDKKSIEQVYDGFARNMQWWITDRDSNGDGLFLIDDQLETGMDDIFSNQVPYESVDATSYAYFNLKALEGMAQILGKQDDAQKWGSYAKKTKQAVLNQLWNKKMNFFSHRDPRTGQYSTIMSIAGFYPFFSHLADKEHLVCLNHLFNENEFWAKYPVPSISMDDPKFDPNAFWMGPSWPAATSHIVEGLAWAAKNLDSSLTENAAELFRRAAKIYFTPQVDFHERFNPLTGKPLSKFRDYMHSWWIDLIIKHVVGFTPRTDGKLELKPLPIGLDHFAMEDIPYHGHFVSVYWQRPDLPPIYKNVPAGYVIKVDEEIVVCKDKLEWIDHLCPDL